MTSLVRASATVLFTTQLLGSTVTVAAASPTPCAPGTLSSYMALGSAGCAIGGVVFSNFGASIFNTGFGTFVPWVVGPNGGPILTTDDIFLTVMHYGNGSVGFRARPAQPLTLSGGGQLGQSPWDWRIGLQIGGFGTTPTALGTDVAWSQYTLVPPSSGFWVSEAAIGSTVYLFDGSSFSQTVAAVQVVGTVPSDTYAYNQSPLGLPNQGPSYVLWHSSAAASAPLDGSSSLSDPTFDLQVWSSTTTPEPSNLLMLATGLAGLGLAGRSRRRRSTVPPSDR